MSYQTEAERVEELEQYRGRLNYNEWEAWCRQTPGPGNYRSVIARLISLSPYCNIIDGNGRVIWSATDIRRGLDPSKLAQAELEADALVKKHKGYVPYRFGHPLPHQLQDKQDQLPPRPVLPKVTVTPYGDIKANTAALRRYDHDVVNYEECVRGFMAPWYALYSFLWWSWVVIKWTLIVLSIVAVVALIFIALNSGNNNSYTRGHRRGLVEGPGGRSGRLPGEPVHQQPPGTECHEGAVHPAGRCLMRYWKALVALGLVASVSVLGTQVASATTTDPSRVSVDPSGRDLQVRPQNIDLYTSSSFALSNLTWSSWGPTSAFGEGTQNKGVGSGTFPVKVILSNVVGTTWGPTFTLLTALSAGGGTGQWDLPYNQEHGLTTPVVVLSIPVPYPAFPTSAPTATTSTTVPPFSPKPVPSGPPAGLPVNIPWSVPFSEVMGPWRAAPASLMAAVTAHEQGDVTFDSYISQLTTTANGWYIYYAQDTKAPSWYEFVVTASIQVSGNVQVPDPIVGIAELTSGKWLITDLPPGCGGEAPANVFRDTGWCGPSYAMGSNPVSRAISGPLPKVYNDAYIGDVQYKPSEIYLVSGSYPNPSWPPSGAFTDPTDEEGGLGNLVWTSWTGASAEAAVTDGHRNVLGDIIVSDPVPTSLGPVFSLLTYDGTADYSHALGNEATVGPDQLEQWHLPVSSAHPNTKFIVSNDIGAPDYSDDTSFDVPWSTVVPYPVLSPPVLPAPPPAPTTATPPTTAAPLNSNLASSGSSTYSYSPPSDNTPLIVFVIVMGVIALVFFGLFFGSKRRSAQLRVEIEAETRARWDKAESEARARTRDAEARLRYREEQARANDQEGQDEVIDELLVEYNKAKAWAEARFVQIFKERRKTGSEALAWYAVLLEVDAKLKIVRKDSVEGDAWANLRDDIDASLRELLNEDPAKITARFDAQLRIDDDEVLRKAYEVYRTWKETSGGESDAARDLYENYCNKNGVTVADKRLIEARYRNEYKAA